MKAQLHARPGQSRLGQGRPVLRCLLFVLLSTLTGCSGASQPEAEWATATKIAGKALGLSHISGLVIDDQFAYVTIGGTLADQQAGTSGYAEWHATPAKLPCWMMGPGCCRLMTTDNSQLTLSIGLIVAHRPSSTSG